MPEEPLITLVLPYYNEAGYIAATLASLAAQSDRRFRLILVDNGSTDESARIASLACKSMPDIPVQFLEESTPGKLYALAAGIGGTVTPYVGTIDADTFYPADYVAKALVLFAAKPNASCALAFGLTRSTRWGLGLAKVRLFARIFPRKCHTGGYGQCFRLDCLNRTGGFDADRWPYVLEDHEIIHRVLRRGPIVYGPDFCCFPSDRRGDRTGCSWTLLERVLYKFTPGIMMDWFFYRFLARRFERRGLGNVRLRTKNWMGCSDSSADHIR